MTRPRPTPAAPATSCPLEAVRFVPAMAVARSAIDSLRVTFPSASRIAMLSAATLTVAAVRSFKSRAIVMAAVSLPLLETVVPPLVALATVAA